MRTHSSLMLTALALVLLSMPARRVDAGCGCDKPPPPLAAVRPAFASPGDVVTLFAMGIKDGDTYTVKFKAGARGKNTTRVTVPATAVVRRDFADGIMKPQLVVRAPDLPPGPARIVVKLGGGRVLRVPATAFTMLQRPVPLAEAAAETVAQCYRAAVGRDGTVYVPVDISTVAERMIFRGVGKNYPLLYDADDIAIYNTQGVLMQLLGPNQAGIYAIEDPGVPDSFALTYDRHEFVTYRLEHAHADGYGLDASDPAWHLDGTRHIDHDHLVVAIRGVLQSTNGAPLPGSTPPFDLSIGTTLPDEAATAAVTRTLAWDDCSEGAIDANADPTIDEDDL